MIEVLDYEERDKWAVEAIIHCAQPVTETAVEWAVVWRFGVDG